MQEFTVNIKNKKYLKGQRYFQAANHFKFVGLASNNTTFCFLSVIRVGIFRGKTKKWIMSMGCSSHFVYCNGFRLLSFLALKDAVTRLRFFLLMTIVFLSFCCVIIFFLHSLNAIHFKSLIILIGFRNLFLFFPLPIRLFGLCKNHRFHSLNWAAIYTICQHISIITP